MLDPTELEGLIVDVFENQQVYAEVIFRGIDIEPEPHVCKYIYNFALLFSDKEDKYNVESYLRCVRDKVQELKSLEAPCEIILAITVV